MKGTSWPGAVVAAMVALAPAPASTQTAEVPIHDPVMIQTPQGFVAFGTGRGIATWISEDGMSWRPGPPVFSETPAWVVDRVPGFDGNIWAPDIFLHDGVFYLYYSVSAFGRNNSAIAVATNPTLNPDDPGFGWTDHGIVVQSVPGRDLWNAIDPHLVLDRDGVPWMSFGSHWGGIKLVRMDPGLERIAEPEEWHTIAARHRYWKLDERDAGDSANPDLDYGKLYPDEILALNRASENGAIEAPVIFWKNGYYYLFASWDRCCRGAESTYKVVVGRSRSIAGPYLDREGEEMIFGGGSLVVQGFPGSDRWAAGGHNDVITIGEADYLVFHAYDTRDEGRSKLLVREIAWDPFGWPVVTLEEHPG